MQLKNYSRKMKVKFGLKFETQHLGLSIFYPYLGSNNPALFRVYEDVYEKRVLCSSRLFLFDQKYSKGCYIVNYYFNLK